MMKLNGDEVGLDIGCGDGKITSVISKKLSSGLIKGLDQSPSMIRFSQKKYASSKCQFILGDFEDFNESEVYDFITVFSAFYCFKDPEESYKKIIRALKPGGKAYIMTYPKEDPVWITCHQALLSNPNWEEIERTSIFNRLLPINKHLSILKSLPIEISLFEPKDTFSYHTDFSDFELYLKSWGVLCTDLTGSSYEDYINKALLFTKPVLINEHGCIKAPCKYINIILSKTPLGSNI
ncbi:MAG: Trans-aconitate 2-methyltransferase [Chlamydiae bacterium]|nr:Trans-aconitate 2-methyltransferase [Chlamydiota bacterium]